MLTKFYNLRPDEVKPGMVFAVIVTCHIDRMGLPRLYRCPYPNAQAYGGIPQGDRIHNFDEEVVKALFPVAHWAQKEGE